MKTNSLFKRLVSMLIVVLMICTLFPVTALAKKQPPQPNYDVLKDLLKVEIDCETEENGEDIHNKIIYELLDNIEGLKPSFSVGEVKGKSCTVTVFSDRYIDKYNEDTTVIHSPEKNKDKNKRKTVTLKYENNKWELDDDDDEIEFEVECNGIPTPPQKPDNNTVEGLLVSDAVTIDCTNSYAGHDDGTYGLIAGSYNVSEPTLSGDKYTCTVTVTDPTPYVAEYNGSSNGHSLSPEEQDPQTITLDYDKDHSQWTVRTGSAPVIFTVDCNTPAPAVKGITKEVVISQPTDLTNVSTGITYPDANNIATVDYGTTSVTLLYKVTVRGDVGASYSVTDTDATCISNNANGTIPQGGEAVLYFTKTFTGLTTGDNKCSNTAAVGNTNSNTVDVTVKVSIPEKPTEKYLEEELLANGAVKIHCTKDTDCNDDETYNLISDTYQIGDVVPNTATGEYTCTITVTAPAPYAEQYNSDKHSKGFTNEHTLCPDQGSKTIILEYNESTSKWNVKTDSAPVTFNVVCGDVPTEPEPPAKEYLEKLLASGAVTIDCVNSEVDHEDKTYGLLTGSYDIGKPQKDEKTGKYTCDITVYAEPYVNKYSTDIRKEHSLDDDKSKTITLIYDDNYGWDVARAERATAPALAGVTFNVVCSSTTYTVTYKDGVGGKVFKDDVHTVESGATTPAFVGGIPTRPGYVFVGWTPAVSKTVTGNATYTATWRKVKDTTVIEIGGGNSSSSSSKEENPNTGAPVFVGVSVGALAAAK